MLPYSRGLMLDNANNYGIVKTETVFGFGPSGHDNYVERRFNSTEPLEWIIASGNFAPRSLQVPDPETRSLKQAIQEPRHKKGTKKDKMKHSDKKKKRQGKGKLKKCIFKVIKKSKKNSKFSKMQKKYMMPLILGLLAAKSLLIPIALKALAFLATKGLVMGFFSTVMASVLSLKGMFDHSNHYQNRKDDSGKTQVEIIQVPSKNEDHVYYDEHYRRGDYVPVPVMVH